MPPFKRKGQYKRGLVSGTGKRRKALQSLRKEWRDKTLASKRRRNEDDSSKLPPLEDFQPILEDLGKRTVPVEIVAALRSLRKLLSREDAPLEEICGSGAIPLLLRHVASPSGEIQLECLWCITNIAAGGFSSTVAAMAALPHLNSRLESTDALLQEQAAWAIGNISGTPECRQQVMASGSIGLLVAAIKRTGENKVTERCLWALANLAKGAEIPIPVFVDSGAITVALEVIRSDRSTEEATGSALWVVVYFSARASVAELESFLSAGLSALLVDGIQGKSPALLTPALRAIGNIVTLPDPRCTNVFFESRAFLPSLFQLLGGGQGRCQSIEAAWVIASVAATSIDHAWKILCARIENNLPAVVLQLLTLVNSGFFLAQKEGLIALHVLLAAGVQLNHPELLGAVATVETLTVLATLCSAADQELASTAVSMFALVLRHVDGAPALVESCGGYEALETLQFKSQEEAVTEFIKELLEECYGDDYGENDDGDEDIAFDAPPLGGSAGRGRHLTRPAWLSPPALGMFSPGPPSPLVPSAPPSTPIGGFSPVKRQTKLSELWEVPEGAVPSSSKAMDVEPPPKPAPKKQTTLFEQGVTISKS